MRPCAIPTVLLLVLTSTLAHAERFDVRAFMAGTHDGGIYEGAGATIDTDTGVLTGVSKAGERVELDFDDLSYLQISRGSKAGERALLGGLVGALTVAAAVADVGANPDEEVDTSAIAPVAAVSVGVGALIGALIGRGQQDWESFDVYPELSIRRDRRAAPVVQLTWRF